MLKKSNKNSGMSLIEVIVSMLVLSIAVIAVTMSFSTASKINMGSRQKQDVDALMENLLEYAEAGGTEYESWFRADSATPESTGVATKTKTLYKGIKQGLYAYDVRVLEDTAPTTEYNTLNTEKVIQFGGSSNTIMIDASLNSNNRSRNAEIDTDPDIAIADQDEKAYETFYAYHHLEVLEEEEAGASPTLIPLSEIPNYVDRELRLEVTVPAEDKMQLTAYFYYELCPNASSETLLYPASGAPTFLKSTPLFTTLVYDDASASDDGTTKLKQIYIMYSPAVKEREGCGLGQDIRVMDPSKAMNATIFIANQQTAVKELSNAVTIDAENLDSSTYWLKVSAQNPNDPTQSFSPAGGAIYCSGQLNIQGFDSAITAHGRALVAKGEEVRVVKTTFEILEEGTNTVLASKSVTHLQ